MNNAQLEASNKRLRRLLSDIIELADKVSNEYGPVTQCYRDDCFMCQLDRRVEAAKEYIE